MKAIALAFVLWNTVCLAQLNIGNGAYLVGTGGSNIVFTNLSFINNGGFVADAGTVQFNGTQDQTIAGTSATSFYNLAVNKSSGRVALQRNVDANGNIIFTAGLLDLNNFNINLSSSSLLIGETENARITGTNGGYVQITTTLNAPNAANPGNLGVIFTTPKEMGLVQIRRGHRVQTNFNDVNFSINRYYDISPQNNTALNTTLRFSYFDAELNGKNESDMFLWKSNDLARWYVMAATDIRDPQSNFITGRGINDFSRWTLSDAAFPQGVFGPCKDKDQLAFWPNPYTDGFNVGFTSQKSSNATLQLFDVTGRLAASQPISIRTGRNLFNFSFPGLPSGTYIMKIIDSECSMSVGKIIKAR